MSPAFSIRPWEQEDCGPLAAIDHFGPMPEPWQEDDFRATWRRVPVNGLIFDSALYGLAAYLLYEVCDEELTVIKFAVRADWQRQGLGERMFRALIEKARIQKKAIVATLPETFLGAQLFLNRLGFTARLLRGHYGNEDGLIFVYPAKEGQTDG